MTPIAFLDPFDLIASLPKRMGLFGGADKWGRRIMVGGDWVWPEYTAMVDHIEGLSDQATIDRCWYEMLDPDALIPWRKPKTNDPMRFVMALRTNPAVMLFDPAACNPLIGQLLMVNPGKPTSAMNLGETSAILLWIEARRTLTPSQTHVPAASAIDP